MATRSLDQVPIHEIIPDATVEIQQLRQQVIALTDQLAQLEAANQAWQLYQQTQLGTFVNKLHPHFSFDNTTSFDQLADRILEQINVEREENTNRSESLDRSADQLRAGNSKMCPIRWHDYLRLLNRVCNNDGDHATVLQRSDRWLESGVSQFEADVRTTGCRKSEPEDSSGF